MTAVAWKCAAASIVGSDHERAGAPCSDAWFARREPLDDGAGHVLTVCISDGAGSAQHGGAGARIVARGFARWLGRHFTRVLDAPPQEVGPAVLEPLRLRLARAARCTGASVAAFAATLVAVAASPRGEWVALHVGDGGIVGRFDGVMRLISAPRKGEFANETYFVTDGDALEQLVVARGLLGDASLRASAFLLFTDGVERALLSRSTGAIAPAAERMASWLDRHAEPVVAAALAEGLRGVLRAGTTDDCTVAMLVC